MDTDGLAQVFGRLVGLRGDRRGLASSLEEVGALGGLGGDRQRLVEEAQRLLVGAERGRPLGGRPKRDARLGGERLRLGPSAASRWAAR